MELKIHTTSDYSLFKTLKGNRDVNHLHLARLKESMKKKHLTTIIMVNEFFEIIDGQHRFLISKELGLPVNYIVQKNYGLNEVQILNANMKNWTILDYVDGYCNMGFIDYKIFREFVNEYGFSNQVAMYLLSGEIVNGTSEVSASTKFKDGKFKVLNLSESKKLAKKIQMIKPYYDGYLRRSFIYALVGILKNKIFDFNEFLLKLKQQPTALKDCTNISQYKELIENIYNFRRREKINLRF